MKPFFIYCLPRSGSCWLSVFLTAFDSYCYHEPLADMTPMQLGARFSQRPDYAVGAVDTGAYHHQHGSIEGAISGVRSFVLKRDVKEIQASADMNHARFDADEQLGRLLTQTTGMPELDFHRFGDVHYLKEIWAELVGTPFDLERAQFFVELNITRDLTKFFGRRPYLKTPGISSVENMLWH